MQWYVISLLALLISSITAQRLVGVPQNGRYSSNANNLGSIARQNPRNEIDAGVGVEIPNILGAGVQIVKQAPFVEILKLVESFLKLKGELASSFWNIIYDNAHILIAVRDTLISKISSVHHLTLGAIVILRKVLEFASTLFGNLNFNVGGSGSFFNAGVNFG